MWITKNKATKIDFLIVYSCIQCYTYTTTMSFTFHLKIITDGACTRKWLVCDQTKICQLLDEEWVDADGNFHRDGLPAVQRFSVYTQFQPPPPMFMKPDGKYVGEVNEYRYFQHGILHREDGPAKHSTGLGYSPTYWYYNGKLHREDGPAVYGSKTSTMWYRHGVLHREDGPAVNHRGDTPERYGTNTTLYGCDGTNHKMDCEVDGCDGCLFEEWINGEFIRSW